MAQFQLTGNFGTEEAQQPYVANVLTTRGVGDVVREIDTAKIAAIWDAHVFKGVRGPYARELCGSPTIIVERQGRLIGTDRPVGSLVRNLTAAGQSITVVAHAKAVEERGDYLSEAVRPMPGANNIEVHVTTTQLSELTV